MLLSVKIRYRAMIKQAAGDQQDEHDHRDPLRRHHRLLLGFGRVARRTPKRRTRTCSREPGRSGRALGGHPSAARLSLRWCHRSSSIRDRGRIEERCDKPGGHTVARGPCTRDRQLRQLRLQPRPVRRRTRRRSGRRAQRRPDGRRRDRPRARPRAALAGPGPSRDERHHLRCHRRVRGGRHTAARRVSRPPGDRPRLRRVRRRRSRTHARQDVGRRAHRRGGVPGHRVTDHRHPLSLPDARPADDPRRPRRHRPHRATVS